MADTVYQLSDVVKRYRKGRGEVLALRGVNLVICDGEWLAIQGSTGHGKSTLLQILGGLDRPTSGFPAAERRMRAEEGLSAVGLGDRLRHLSSELSGGQQQRGGNRPRAGQGALGAARRRADRNLDEGTRDEIIALLEDLWRRRGLTMVLVTHDSAVAGRAPRIGLMRDGQFEDAP
jgi:putative ABC transport system ATP-binding protein